MTPPALLPYLATAFVYAAFGTAAVAAVLRALGRRVDGPPMLTVFLALFFLALTQHPLPARATLDCTDGGVASILKPFATFDHVGRLWRYWRNVPGIGVTAFATSRVIQAAVMNLVLCAAIGAAYARHAGGRWAWVKAFGLGATLSGGAELAQLTGLFGLYPCPWRTFEVDDLIFNIAGVMGGFALIRGGRAAESGAK